MVDDLTAYTDTAGSTPVLLDEETDSHMNDAQLDNALACFVQDVCEALSRGETADELRRSLDAGSPDIAHATRALVEDCAVSPMWLRRLERINAQSGGVFATEVGLLSKGVKKFHDKSLQCGWDAIDTFVFVSDVISVLESHDYFGDAGMLASMMYWDGADVNGAVTNLIQHGLATQEWVDRLRQINRTTGGDYCEELAELRAALEAQNTACIPGIVYRGP